MSEHVTRDSWKQSIRTILTLQKKYQTSETVQGRVVANVFKHLYELLTQLLDSQYFDFGADDIDVLTCFFKYINPDDLKKSINGSSVVEKLIDHLNAKIKLTAGEFWTVIVNLQNDHHIFVLDLLLKKQKLILNPFLVSNREFITSFQELPEIINYIDFKDIDFKSFEIPSVMSLNSLNDILICLDIDQEKYKKFSCAYFHANQGKKLQYSNFPGSDNMDHKANLQTLVKIGILAFDSKMLKLMEEWKDDHLSSKYIITNAGSVKKSDDLSDHLQQLIDCCLQNMPDTHLIFDDMKKIISFV